MTVEEVGKDELRREGARVVEICMNVEVDVVGVGMTCVED
jgi:hypothetical protein